MNPFKKLLSPETKFKCDEELELAVEQSKLSIISAIEEGVEIFYLSRTTLLSPTSSRKAFATFFTKNIATVPHPQQLLAVRMGGRLCLQGPGF